jgi:hypothetical protein
VRESSGGVCWQRINTDIDVSGEPATTGRKILLTHEVLAANIHLTLRKEVV